MKKCTLCEQEGKYKCPTCNIEYCSSNCFKKHKADHCQEQPKIIENHTQEDESNPKQDEYITKDTVPLEKLHLLGNNKKVRDLLENVHLREFIKEIDKTPKPEQMMQKAMMEPIFVEFVDACLSVVQDDN